MGQTAAKPNFAIIVSWDGGSESGQKIRMYRSSKMERAKIIGK